MKLEAILETINVDNNLMKEKVIEVEKNCSCLSEDLIESIRKVSGK